jgi:thymidylate synthase
MNSLDKQYRDLLKTILEHGIEKKDRTGTGTKSIFGYTIRHNMKDGFPLLTTKKMPFKTIASELIWFLRGDTNIKFLVDNGCHIWDGDCYQAYIKRYNRGEYVGKTKLLENSKKNRTLTEPFTKEEFINRIKTDDEFAKQWGELGPIYGKQWRSWRVGKGIETSLKTEDGQTLYEAGSMYIDQTQNLINDLKTNPDSRRLMVNAWNVGELDQMVLPPCHYGFQVYTRELSMEERRELVTKEMFNQIYNGGSPDTLSHSEINQWNVPTRAISLMWNQRSVDTFLGLPFNIASYGLLLEIIAKAVNMVPDQLIGNLGDTHLYLNHLDQAQEQIGRDYTPEERHELLKQAMGDFYQTAVDEQVPFGGGLSEYYEAHKIPRHSREPYPLPRLNINTEWWPTESGECGDGPIDATAVFSGFSNDNFCKCLLEEDLQLANYKSHPTIKAPLSN